jgi:hypothetical protein
MQIEYPRSLEDISRERQEELERDIRHFLTFSPSQRLIYVEKEWLSVQSYIREFGIPWNRSST